MAYTGEILDACGLIGIDCTQIAVVAVSGDGPNLCGHLLLHTGPARGGYYFHVAEFRGRPRYLSESGYQRYSQGAFLYLEGLMANTWTWLVVPNNCVAFVEEVIQAGGGTWGSYSNCPDLATQDTLSERIERFLGQMENEIYRLYGVPRF